jgi:hypothetical protein
MRRRRTTRTVELTVERTEFSTPRGPRPNAVAWCGGCGRSAPFVTPEEAARSTGAGLRTVFRQIEAAEIHFLETADGVLLVCLDSLAPFS